NPEDGSTVEEDGSTVEGGPEVAGAGPPGEQPASTPLAPTTTAAPRNSRRPMAARRSPPHPAAAFTARSTLTARFGLTAAASPLAGAATHTFREHPPARALGGLSRAPREALLSAQLGRLAGPAQRRQGQRDGGQHQRCGHHDEHPDAGPVHRGRTVDQP